MTQVKIFFHLLRPQRWVCSFAVILVACISLSWSENSVLSAIIPPGSPVIKGKQISYTIKFVFDHCPKRYWSYPDIEHKMVVIEVYDYEIKVDDSMKLNIVSPLKSVEVKNSSTSLVLSGRQSNILVHLKEEMNSEPAVSGDTLILTVWKTLPASEKKNKKRKINPVPIISVAVVLVCAGLTAMFINSAAANN
jgi:hypothetical protein